MTGYFQPSEHREHGADTERIRDSLVLRAPSAVNTVPTLRVLRARCRSNQGGGWDPQPGVMV